MSEVKSTDYSELIDDAVDNLGEGYDFTVLISKASAEACIAANKTSKLRAVVCKTQSDAMKARKAKANMIIIDAADLNKTSASSIMRGWFNSSSAPDDADAETDDQAPAPSSKGKGMFSMLHSGSGIVKGKSKPKAKAAQPAQDEEEDDDAEKPKGGGIVNNLKYIFGIE
jgi:hypothetical protein